MIKLILFIAFYLITTYIAYKNCQKTYSKGGQFDILEPTFLDFIFVFLPIANIIYSFVFYEKTNKESILNKIFNIKK